MTHNKENIKNKNLEKLSNDFLKNLDVQFPTTKDQAWQSIESRMKNYEVQKAKANVQIYKRFAIAASLTILLLSASILRYYSVDVRAKESALNVSLPDNSQVKLEPGSELKYNPLWWRISRNLKLEGTAEFQVIKGNKFEVKSRTGYTEVIGTGFIIETGVKLYRVLCLSGSVKVSDRKSNVSAVLSPNELAELKGKGIFEIRLIEKNVKKMPSEIEYFDFRNMKIQNVFEEIEDQFGVIILLSEELDYVYTGNLKKGLDLESLLNAVCLPFNLKYEQISQNKYMVLPKGN